MKPGVWPFCENGFRAFHRAKMSCEDTQYKHNKLNSSSKNQIDLLKPYTCIVKLYANAYFRKYAPEYAKSFHQCSHTWRRNEKTSTPTVFVSST